MDQQTDVNALIKAKIAQLEGKAMDAQWNTQVQWIRDNGSLKNAIAVVEASRAMTGPQFSDGTTPMHRRQPWPRYRPGRETPV
jgi:hypothetical protein